MNSNESQRRKRRSYEDRIAELEAEIARQKHKLVAKKEKASKKRELPESVKGIPKIAKKLQEFAALAHADKRMDIFNSVSLFLAGLQRMYDQEVAAREVEELEPEAEASQPPEADRDADRAELTGRRAAPRGRPRASEPVTLEPRPTRRGGDERPAAASKAERLFDERLRAVAQDTQRRAIDPPSLSEWER
jgi:hypothetical protein